MSSDRQSGKSSSDSSENENEASRSVSPPVSPSKSNKESLVRDSKDGLEGKQGKSVEFNAGSNHQEEMKDTTEVENKKRNYSENEEKERSKGTMISEKVEKHKNDRSQTRSPSPKVRKKKSRSQSPRNYEKGDSAKRSRKYPEPKHDSKREKVRNRSRSPSKSEKMGSERSRNKHKSEHTDKNKEILTTKTGGAYIPPAKLRLMQAQITDKSSEQFQRLAWEALKKSINGLINKVNSPNIGIIVRELFAENIVRGRGLLCLSIMQAQTASPTFTHVYAALGAIINSKFPNIGKLLLKRLIINFKRGYKRNDKIRCVSSTRFIAHLVNQQVNIIQY